MIKSIIVDDEPRNIVMLQSLLRDYCSEVDVLGTAMSVKEGIALIEQFEPQLIFLDIEMPYVQ
jgi:two-component system LytT family response regulator